MDKNNYRGNHLTSLIYIASEVRSGSTLLNNLLSNHPGLSSIGELRNLHSYQNKGQAGASVNWLCTCGLPVNECRVWTQINEYYEKEYQQSLVDVDTLIGGSQRTKLYHPVLLLSIIIPFKGVRQWLLRHAYHNSQIQKFGRESFQILDVFSRVMNVRGIVDSSKRMGQLYSLVSTKPADVDLKMIHLVRDGRAVVYSKMKRADVYQQYGYSFRLISAIRGWVYNNLKIQVIKSFFDPENKVTIRYEDLCADREITLQKICRRFRIPYEDSMLNLSNENRHNIGGSPHRFSWNPETLIQLDERWKENMPVWHKMIYFIIAGVVHKSYGY